MALFDSITGDNDYRRKARAEKEAAHSASEASKAAAEASRAEAAISKAQANLIEKQAEAEEEAREKAEEQEFLSQLSNLKFAGDLSNVQNDMEAIYQLWLTNKRKSREHKKLINEKLEYGLMTLKGLDNTKGSYYENKINAEKKHRKIMTIIKIVGGVVAAIVLLIVMAVTSDY